MQKYWKNLCYVLLPVTIDRIELGAYPYLLETFLDSAKYIAQAANEFCDMKAYHTEEVNQYNLIINAGGMGNV